VDHLTMATLFRHAGLALDINKSTIPQSILELEEKNRILNLALINSKKIMKESNNMIC
jgi:hypothetical protein